MHNILERPDFEPNLGLPRHGWYPFKEGFSASLVASFLLDFVQRRPGLLFDPFLGSGTSCLESSVWGWESVGIEVNPFMAFLSRVKTEKVYDASALMQAFQIIAKGKASASWRLPGDTTLVERDGLDKWLFNKAVARRFEELRACTAEAPCDQKHRDLILLALISSMRSVANAKNDGKCWRYHQYWRVNRYNGKDLDDAFARTILRYANDIRGLSGLTGSAKVHRGDSRAWLARSAPRWAGRFDAVLTSPPYLNSFDYTDIYRPECFLLGAARNSRELREIRFQTLRSHVQVDWPKPAASEVPSVREAVQSLTKKRLWNRRLPEMVNAYFVDLENVIRGCRVVVKPGGVFGFVVASSAYGGKVIHVDEVLQEIMALNGIEVIEVRRLRETLGNGNHQRRRGGLLREVLVVGRTRAHGTRPC